MIRGFATRGRTFGSPAAQILGYPAAELLVPSSLRHGALSQVVHFTHSSRRLSSSRCNHDTSSSVRWNQVVAQVPATPIRPLAQVLARTPPHQRSLSQTTSLRKQSRTTQLSTPRLQYVFKASYSTQRESESNKAHASEKEASESGLPNTSESKHKSLYDRLPQIPHYHRPTKEELLAAATGFWSRLKVRFKWFSIRSVRPFNSDEIGALLSWVFLGNVLWILLGTTTFASLIIWLVNTVSAQETLARWVGTYLTKSSGVKVVFESAIVPNWRGGVISFRNVFISRRSQGQARVSKGSPETAAAAAAAAGQLPAANEDTNFTQYDLTLESVNVTLSFAKWFNGQGLLSDVEVSGVRGVIDRRNVHYTGEKVDPKSYRHQSKPGDLEMSSFKLKDLMVSVYQPNGFRPFTVSIFSCDLPKLRQRWLFYDFLCANNVSGSFDDSLFTIHPRQLHRSSNDRSNTESASASAQQARLRIDALKIDHLNRGTEGPFSWIHEGTVDLIADVMFPAEADDGLIAKFLSEIKNTRLARSKQGGDVEQNGLTETIETFMAAPSALDSVSKQSEDRRLLIMDLRVNFHDVRAGVPLLTRDLSYVNNALIRPIVGYINSRNTYIPINCRLAKRVTDFDGSWTLYDSGLLDDISAETYNAIVQDITDNQARIRRFKKVGLWSLQLAVQALFMGMAGVIA